MELSHQSLYLTRKYFEDVRLPFSDDQPDDEQALSGAKSLIFDRSKSFDCHDTLSSCEFKALCEDFFDSLNLDGKDRSLASGN